MPVGLERGYRIKTRGSSRQPRCRMDRCRRNARPMVPCWLPGKIFSNYLIGATDAHAKNHSLLLIAPDDIRLAPLYDVASIAPYRPLAPRHESRAHGISRKHGFRHPAPNARASSRAHQTRSTSPRGAQRESARRANPSRQAARCRRSAPCPPRDGRSRSSPCPRRSRSRARGVSAPLRSRSRTACRP